MSTEARNEYARSPVVPRSAMAASSRMGLRLSRTPPIPSRAPSATMPAAVWRSVSSPGLFNQTIVW